VACRTNAGRLGRTTPSQNESTRPAAALGIEIKQEARSERGEEEEEEEEAAEEKEGWGQHPL